MKKIIEYVTAKVIVVEKYARTPRGAFVSGLVLGIFAGHFVLGWS